MALDKTTTSLGVGLGVGILANTVGGASMGTSLLIGGAAMAGTWVALDSAEQAEAKTESLEKELKSARKDVTDMKLKVDGFIDEQVAEKKKAKKAAKKVKAA